MVASTLYPTYARAPLMFERGEGAWLMTKDGERFLDFGSGVAVNSLGHAHPHLVEILQEQGAKLWHVSNLFEIEQQERLSQRLCENTFADMVFFTNSGAEAVECAIKSARRYHYNNGDSERYEIITFEGAFHGRTIATIAAGGQEKYMEGFGPKAPGFIQVPVDDLDALHGAVSDKTAGILIEPIQGEGGLRVISADFMRAIRAICDETGALMMLDEVQSGAGRTGKFFAHELSGITPDIMAIAKGIGGGFPLGACLATQEVGAAMVPGTHGSTYGGNPLATAIGNGVLDVVLEDGFLDEVERKALLLKQGLASLVDRHNNVFEAICGEGLMTGLKCKVPNVDVVGALRDKKMLAIPAGDNVVRLLPPLTVTDEEIALAIERLSAAATAL